MCGITAYIGTEQSIEILVNSLKTLSNRGYDSAGVMLSNTRDSNCSIIVKKSVTKGDKLAIEELEKYTETIKSAHDIGIGHTRWATHGITNMANCHPHNDNNKDLYLVHNGIIENYKELKELLILNDYTFYSDTDTEVIVNLLAYYYKITGDMIQSIKKTTGSLQGTFGVCFYHKEFSNKLFCFKRGSPIMISVNDTFIMVASEISGFNGLTTKYFPLDNDDYCVIEKTDTGMTFASGNIYDSINIDESFVTNNKEGFKHWTLKEIHEQPISLQRTINNGARLRGDYGVKLGGLENQRKTLNGITNCIIIGCGTSNFAAKIGIYYFRSLATFDSVVSIDGCEFVEEDIPNNGSTMAILLSQSGETRDLHNCLSILKRRGVLTVGCINVPDSLIAQQVDCGVYLNAGKEVGVASTKSFTSQLVVLCLIAIWFGEKNPQSLMKIGKYINSIRKLSTEVKYVINKYDVINNMVQRKDFKNKRSMFLLGKGRMSYVAHEGALKIKELSYCHAEAYSGSALKHGPFSLLEEGFPVIIIIHKDEFYNKMCSVYEEIKTRCADILVITNDANFAHDDKIVVNTTSDIAEIQYAVVLQIIAYTMSVSKGINSDYPRNLAKVVTVD